MSSGQKKTITIVIGVIIAFLLGIIATSTTVVIGASSGKALPDYEKNDASKPLYSEENPFTILEIVPDVESATVGYLIKGSEPGESDRLMRIGATNKNEEGTAANIYDNAFGKGSNPVSYVGDYETAHLFQWDASTIDYVGFDLKFDEYQGMYTPGADKGFSEFGYFTKVNSYGGSYVYNTDKQRFEPVGYFNKDLYDHYDWTSLGEFKHVGQGGVEQGKIACTREMYTEDGQPKQFSYDNGTQSGSVNGAVGDKAYNYYFTSIGDFQWTPNNNYNGENIFGENAKDEDIRRASEGDKLYMTRTEDIYYEYEASPISCNDLLVKELLENDKASALNYKVKVVTVTPSQLDVGDANATEANKAKDIIDDADMIIIHDSTTGFRIEYALRGETVLDAPQFANSNDSSGDLPVATVNYMIERGAGYDASKGIYPASIVIDDDAIVKANSYGNRSSLNCPNLKLLCDVYNNLGAKLAYNLSGSNYSVKLNNMINDSEYKTFYRNYDYANRGEFKDTLGRSNFVYNYEGKDDSWLTTDFGNSAKINNNSETSPAFENVDGGQTMSVAKMMLSLYRESIGYNQPKNIRLLELQPNEKFYYEKRNRDSWVKRYVSLFPWFIGTSKDIGDGDINGNGDVKITTMPTYEFIGRNEDVNENYDMIVVGNKVQDETNGKLGYNDAGLGNLVYTAVGDLITTFGGDEESDKNIENNESYRWHYGLFRNNKWSWTQHAYIEEDSGWYVYSSTYANFRKHFVYEFYDYQDGDDILSNGVRGPWYYSYVSKTPHEVFGSKHGSDANMIGLRYSGNDLTKKKYDQLLDFSKQGPVIVADDLYGNSDSPNTEIVDKSSFVYQLAKKNGDSAVNKYLHGATDRLYTVKKNMEDNKCSATFTNTVDNKAGMPKEYVQTDSNNANNQTDAAGNNLLQYHFVLSGNKDSTYGVNLYTDSNGNGIFEGCINFRKERDANDDRREDYDKEISSSLTIFDESVNGYVVDGKLYSNHTYLVTKTMPPSDVGMIPWKLEIYNTDNDSVRFSKTGYTRIPANNNKTTIKVLQMNLMPDMQNNGNNTVNFADTDSDVGRKFANYIKQLDDFNVQIQFMDNRTWYRNYNGNREAWKNKLLEYDMLVIGFKDVAYFTNNEDYIYGFEEFRKAGKSVILSHDLVEDVTIDMPLRKNNYNTREMIQSDVRYYLRDISGQMRKYYDAANYNVAEPASSDYDYMKYYSNGRQNLTFEPSDNFNIYTSLKQRQTTVLIDTHEMTMEYRDNNYKDTPIYDWYTYVYGNFNDSRIKEYDGTLRHPDHNEMSITTPIKVIRDYYKTHDYKPANMIMDNSVRAMLFYNYIYYVENTKYGPRTGFIDRIDRLVRNINLDVSSQRRKLVWGSEAFLTNRVQAANEGQITKYPFAIPDSIFVADTHAQNYQLDLEYDSDGDVLVWYNLAGTSNRNDGKKSAVNSNSISVYDGKNQDSRNNYYIYTKGNITYTGLGHSKNSDSPMSDDEIKLFINTMVAAYRSSAAKPYINVLNADAVNNGKTSTIYVDGESAEIRFNIFDDTTNAKILSTREYMVTVKKDGVALDGYSITRNNNNKDEPITIPVNYSDVAATGSAEYTIELDSKYIDAFDNTINDEGLDDVRTVNITIMPMFSLR